MIRPICLISAFLSFLFIGTAYAQDPVNEDVLDRADSLFEKGLFKEAIDIYSDYLEKNKTSGAENKEVSSICFENIGLCYYNLDNYTEAIEWFRKALELQREQGDLESVATTLNNIGMNYKMRGNYDKAVEYYEQTIQIDEELGKGNEIAKTLNNIGMVYRAWGKYDKAIDYFERSLRIKNSLNDLAGASKTINNMGLVYSDWKKHDQAILNFRETLRIEHSLGNEGEEAKRLNNLGWVYFHLNKFDSALVYFMKALEIQNRLQDLDQIALSYNNIGKIYTAEDKNKEASLYIGRALEIWDKLGKEGEKATALANLGSINRELGSNARALQFLDSSTRIASKLRLRNQLLQNYLYYSEIYSDLGDYKRSLDYFKKYSQEKDSVFSEEDLRQLSDFQIKYETEKKENEIQLLKQNELIQGLALKKEMLFRNSMLVVSGLLLALAGLIFYSLQQKRKDNRIIAGAMEKSDQLLLNILPAGVANDLKEQGKTKPQLFTDVTACFVDIVNFTEKSTEIEPAVLISELNEIFTAFDNIIEKYSCERIKTIGDSYLAVSGLPLPDPMHAFKIVSCCVDMIRFMKKRNSESPYLWEIRAGVHTGDVIAGVVGVKKYIYDVFGDTINTASRMETHSEPMKVNISESTYILVKDKFGTEPRGALEIKGKGKLQMYFVKV